MTCSSHTLKGTLLSIGTSLGVARSALCMTNLPSLLCFAIDAVRLRKAVPLTSTFAPDAIASSRPSAVGLEWEFKHPNVAIPERAMVELQEVIKAADAQRRQRGGAAYRNSTCRSGGSRSSGCVLFSLLGLSLYAAITLPLRRRPFSS